MTLQPQAELSDSTGEGLACTRGSGRPHSLSFRRRCGLRFCRMLIACGPASAAGCSVACCSCAADVSPCQAAPCCWLCCTPAAGCCCTAPAGWPGSAGTALGTAEAETALRRWLCAARAASCGWSWSMPAGGGDAGTQLSRAAESTCTQRWESEPLLTRRAESLPLNLRLMKTGLDGICCLQLGLKEHYRCLQCCQAPACHQCTSSTEPVEEQPSSTPGPSQTRRRRPGSSQP